MKLKYRIYCMNEAIFNNFNDNKNINISPSLYDIKIIVQYVKYNSWFNCFQNKNFDRSLRSS